MALAPGTGGTLGGSLPPPGQPAPPLPAPINPHALGGMGGAPPSTRLFDIANTPTITTPDYNALLAQIMAPYEALQQQQLAALQEQTSKEGGFAKESYGINKDSAEAAHNEAIRRLVASLVARGMYSSGDKPYLTGQENDRFGRQIALLTNSLQQYLYGLTSQLTNARLASQSALAQQRVAIAPSIAQQYPATVTYPFGSPGIHYAPAG